MNSCALPSFWDGYHALEPSEKTLVQKAYRLWMLVDGESLSSFFEVQVHQQTGKYLGRPNIAEVSRSWHTSLQYGHLVLDRRSR